MIKLGEEKWVEKGRLWEPVFDKGFDCDLGDNRHFLFPTFLPLTLVLMSEGSGFEISQSSARLAEHGRRQAHKAQR